MREGGGRSDMQKYSQGLKLNPVLCGNASAHTIRALPSEPLGCTALSADSLMRHSLTLSYTKHQYLITFENQLEEMISGSQIHRQAVRPGRY